MNGKNQNLSQEKQKEGENKTYFRFKYENNSFELFWRIIVWIIGILLILPIPWVINNQIAYFTRGFKAKEFDEHP